MNDELRDVVARARFRVPVVRAHVRAVVDVVELHVGRHAAPAVRRAVVEAQVETVVGGRALAVVAAGVHDQAVLLDRLLHQDRRRRTPGAVRELPRHLQPVGEARSRHDREYVRQVEAARPPNAVERALLRLRQRIADLAPEAAADLLLREELEASAASLALARELRHQRADLVLLAGVGHRDEGQLPAHGVALVALLVGLHGDPRVAGGTQLDPSDQVVGLDRPQEGVPRPGLEEEAAWASWW